MKGWRNIYLLIVGGCRVYFVEVGGGADILFSRIRRVLCRAEFAFLFLFCVWVGRIGSAAGNNSKNNNDLTPPRPSLGLPRAYPMAAQLLSKREVLK